jgi:mercuric ion transport protein
VNVAAFAVASCCGLPFILTTLGVGTAWLYGVAILAAPHRAFLLVAAAVCLAGGAILLVRQHRTTALCAPGEICTKPAVRGLTAYSIDPDQPFRPIVITDSGDPDHGVHPA